MLVYGVDFSSAPGQRSPIVCVTCSFENNRLIVQFVEHFISFIDFDAFLRSPAPWIAGLDFPFGQPRTLIDEIGWPREWQLCVEKIAHMGKSRFVEMMQSRKRQRRRADKLAKSASPMNVNRPPVGKMFFEGAPRLLWSGVSVIPCHPTGSDRLVVEAYPALVARRFSGESYKSGKNPEQEERVRRHITNSLILSPLTEATFGFTVGFDMIDEENLFADTNGDELDAILCAVQAAWAFSQQTVNFGIPANCDPLEGWIVDPGLLLQQ